MPPNLAPGDELAGYSIERVAGAGGMGAVYRAHAPGGEVVALKVVALPGLAARERFRAEASALQAIEHPGVVRLWAHGTEEGLGWLALEWLDGVDLARHLRERGSSPRDALDWGRQLASALVAVHDAGLVHRDLKPSNILREPAGRLVLVDFGIVGVLGAEQVRGPAGTPGYMAPEQARGAPVDARADLFALGCVLFEAATGRAAFAGTHRVATLARVVLDDVPRAREFRPDIPEALDEAIAPLLQKLPAERPESAAALLQVLEGQALPKPAPARIREETRLEAGELQLVSVIVVSALGDSETVTQLDNDPRVMEQLADRAGANLEVLADGTQLLCLAGVGEAMDCVRRAAECALALHAAEPQLAISLATGSADMSRRRPVGGAVDVAVAQLEGQAPGAPLLDALSARLLRGGAQLSDDGRRLLALGASEFREEKVFGRESLLAACEAQLRSDTRLLLRGPAGIGKSHLGRALRDRLQDKGWRVALARASELSRSVPYAALGRLVLEVLAAEPADVGQLLEARLLEASVPQEAAQAHSALLCHVLRAPSNHALPRALERDPALLDEALTDAWRVWLDAEQRVQPLALFMDDAQWCDAASLRLLDTATPHSLRLVWLARPGSSVEERLTSLEVPPLESGAARELVSSLLGASVPELGGLVRQAEGNPLFLEELARARDEGAQEGAAPTVLAMLQARFAALVEPDRQILRAASVFGRDFERQALPQLLGTQIAGTRLDERLLALRERGVLARSEQRGAGALEFRHDLWREAAYASFTVANRARAHRLAGSFLEETNAAAPGVLAQHFEFGGEERRASHWWVRAAEAAVLASDLTTARTQLGRAGEPPAQDLARAAWVEAELELWGGHMSAAREAASRALSGALPDVLRRRSLALLVQSAGRLGDAEQLRAVAGDCREDPWLACQLAREFVRLGDSAAATRAIGALLDSGELELDVRGELASLRAVLALNAGDYFEQLRHWQSALAAYEQLGMRNAACATL
ncbi:MAG: protein kinase, partial [Polyangiaceae bacterium]